MSSAPLSLYLDLEEGKLADLEVVAKAALAFSAALREAAYVIDPSSEIKIELISGTEGSLSLNSLVSTVKNKKNQIATTSIGSLMVLSMLWFGDKTKEWAYSKFLDLVFEQEDDDGKKLYSKEQVEEITSIAIAAYEKGVAKKQVSDVYKELGKDPAVKGVGVTPVLGDKPDSIVPKAEFPVRAGEVVEAPAEAERRTQTSKERVRLISPVLVPSQRRWKFAGRTGEFGAPIKDADFLDSVLSGKMGVTLMGGIEMDVELETTDVLKDGVWQTIEWDIIKVLNVYPPIIQQSLQLPLPPIPKKKPTDGKKDN